MRIVIEGASAEFERKLLVLLGEHRDELAVTTETAWNVERATLFLSTLNDDARRFVRLVVDSDGHLKAAVLREGFPHGLRGPTVALTNALKRGVKHGWWPENSKAPVSVVYGGGPQDGWRQASAYEMPGENLPAFRAAIARSEAALRPSWDEDAPSPFGAHAGWETQDDVPSALTADDVPSGWAAADDVPRVLAVDPPSLPIFQTKHPDQRGLRG